MKCINPKMQKMVSLYQLDLLSETEKISVEAHLLECDACFEELYRLNPAFELLEEMPERFMEALQPDEPTLTRAIKALRKWTENLKETIDLILSSFAIALDKRILIPVTVAVILAIIFIIPASHDYSELAIIKKAAYSQIRLRDSLKSQPAIALFDKAMVFYVNGKYDTAIVLLKDFLIQEPGDTYAHFYLGVAQLLTNDMKSGISHLQFASEQCQQQNYQILLEKCYWYLGNAYLKINKKDDALKEFGKIIKFQGDFVIEAQKQIDKIEKTSQQ